MKKLALLLPLLALAPLIAARAEGPATNAPAAKPSAIARFASLDDASKFLRDFAAAIGFAGQADDMVRSMREEFEEIGTDPSRPLVGAFTRPFDTAMDGVAFAVPGEEPSAERIGKALKLEDGVAAVRGEDGVWGDPDPDGKKMAMFHRDGYNVFAEPRECLAFADDLLAAARSPRFPGAAGEFTFRAELFRDALLSHPVRSDRTAPSMDVAADLFARCGTFSFGAAFDATAGLLVPFAATPPESDPGAFASFAAAPALDPATALWRDDAIVAFAASDTGRAFGAFFDFYEEYFRFLRSGIEENLRTSGLDEAAISATLAADLPEMCRLAKSVGAMSGFGGLTPEGASTMRGIVDFGDPATAAKSREIQRRMFAAPAATNLFAFAETEDGWTWDFNPAAAVPPDGTAAEGFLPAMRRLYGPNGMHGEMHLVPGTAATYRYAAGPAGTETPAMPAGRLALGALDRFSPGAKTVAAMQMGMSDFIRATLSPTGPIPEGVIPPGGRIRWDLGVRGGEPVGLLAVDPAELRAYSMLLFFGVTHAMAPAAPAPSGDDALFDD